MTPRPSQATSPLTVSEEVRAEHEAIEAVYEDLTRAYRRGDWREVQPAWTVFELSLRTHLNLEEKHLRDGFEPAHPVETKTILDEQAEILGLLSTIGVAIDLHVAREPEIDDLLTRLRAHSHHVEELVSSWRP